MISSLASGPSPASEIVGLAMTWAAGLKHLRVLEASGLVHTEKIGRVRTCALNSAALKMGETWINKVSHPRHQLPR